MKKIKYFLVAVMAVILCLMCLMTTTFSWFTRETKTGNSLTWNSDYQVSDGAYIGMVTYKLNTSSNEYVAMGSDESFSNNDDGIASGNRVCYRTDITNSGENAQSVSLYMSGLKINQGNFYLGVNQPLKTYKMYNTSAASIDGYPSTMRVYFQPDKATEYGWLNKEYQVWYSLSNDAPTQKTSMTKIGHDDLGASNVYYADIPDNAELISFHIKDSSGGNNQTNNIVVSNVGLSKTQSKFFCLNGNIGEWENVSYDNPPANVIGANIIRYYETITIPVNGTFDAKLVKGTDYIGDNITYSSSNEQIFSFISPTSSEFKANAVGTATLTTTVTGTSYEDTFVKTTIVNVVDNDIPIVTNYTVPQAVDENTPSTVSVYWYINNEDSETLTYTIDDVYLSL